MERNAALALVRKNFPASLAEEYIAECEHQEGEEYWWDFDDAQDLLTDVRLYAESKED